MSLTLMYITNRIDVAAIAQDAGVDRIWVDLEYIGKEERQYGMNTVKSNHTIDDIRHLRPYINKSKLLVRTNPIYEASEEEINQVIESGADCIMLPMYRTTEEVDKFIRLVAGRARTILLLETREAVDCLQETIAMPGIDEIHIGLNDLHLSYKRRFMFELLADGTVERICNTISKTSIKYGFGGIARVGYGDLPSELIINEHCRLGSSMAILSRSFCNANTISDTESVRNDFIEGVQRIRVQEQKAMAMSEEERRMNTAEVKRRVDQIVQKKMGC